MKENLTYNYIFGGSSRLNLKTEQNTVFCFSLFLHISSYFVSEKY